MTWGSKGQGHKSSLTVSLRLQSDWISRARLEASGISCYSRKLPRNISACSSEAGVSQRMAQKLLQTSGCHLPSASFSFTFQIACVGRLHLGTTRVRGFWKIFPNSQGCRGDRRGGRWAAHLLRHHHRHHTVARVHRDSHCCQHSSMAVMAPVSQVALPSAPALPSPAAPGPPIPPPVSPPPDHRPHTAVLPTSSEDRASPAVAGDLQNLREGSTIPHPTDAGLGHMA